MKQLIEDIRRLLSILPDQVSVHEVAGEQCHVLELRVAPATGKGHRKTGQKPRAAFARCWALPA